MIEMHHIIAFGGLCVALGVIAVIGDVLSRRWK